MAAVPTTTEFSSTAVPVPTSTPPPWARTTAPWASSDPSPRRAVPSTTAERATCGAPASDSRTVSTGPALMASGEVPGRELVGGNDPEPAGLVVVDGLQDLLTRVHHERAVVSDRGADRQPSQEQDVERLG